MSTNKNARSSLVTKELVKAMGKVLTELQFILRWSKYIADFRYNELNKQAMNAKIAYLLATEAEANGKKVDMAKLVKVILHRMFEKLILCDIREDYVSRILKLGSIAPSKFDAIIEECIEERMGKEFTKFIQVDKDSFEARLFQAATKLATRMELREIKTQIPEHAYINVAENVEKTLQGYNDMPGFSRFSLKYSKEMIFFKDASALRNRIRWSKQLGTVNCSVLGHDFEVAVLSYLMSLEKGDDEDITARCFFIGGFHDLAETFTGDMSSVIKDKIPGLREADEKFELEMLEKYVYQELPEHLANAVKAVVLEEEEQKAIKPLIKQADYLSACWECLRNIIAGNQNGYFLEAILRQITGISGVFREALDEMVAYKTF